MEALIGMSKVDRHYKNGHTANYTIISRQSNTPENKRHPANAGSMLASRLRRRPNIYWTISQRQLDGCNFIFRCVVAEEGDGVHFFTKARVLRSTWTL